MFSASTTSARVCPLARWRSTSSLSDSTAETTKAQPSAASSGKMLAPLQNMLDLDRRVEGHVRELRVQRPRESSERFGPFRKSGSPKVMWRAPAATCARISASTISRGTTKKRPP